MIERRAFLGGTLCAAAASDKAARASPHDAAPPGPEPLVWPVVAELPPGIRSFAGHTDTCVSSDLIRQS